jgi:hypothetical protein
MMIVETAGTYQPTSYKVAGMTIRDRTVRKSDSYLDIIASDSMVRLVVFLRSCR